MTNWSRDRIAKNNLSMFEYCEKHNVRIRIRMNIRISGFEYCEKLSFHNLLSTVAICANSNFQDDVDMGRK